MTTSSIVARTERHPRVIGVAIVLAMTMIYFREAMWGSNLTLIWDNADQAYPFMAYVGHYYRHGVIPLWNSYLLNGYPSFADPMTQTFYPVNLALEWLGDFSPRMVHLQYAVHYFLAGLFMLALCMRFGYPLFAALIAAVSYMFSGYMVGHFSHIIVDVVAWLPMLILALDIALKNRNAAWVVVGGAVFGVMILSGPYQVIFYSTLALGGHWIFRTAMEYRETRQVRNVISSSAILVLMLVIGALIAMVQLLPTSEFIAQTNRSDARSLASAGFGVPIQNLFTLVMPDYFGGISGEDYWADPQTVQLDMTQQNLYMGIVPLFFAGLVLLYRRTAWTFFMAGMALLSLLISMGTNTPLFSFFYHVVPGFAYFRNIVHFLFIFHFYMAILAAEGATLIFGKSLFDKKLIAYLIVFAAGVGLSYWQLPLPPHDEVASNNAMHSLIWFVELLVAFVILLLANYLWRNAGVVKSLLVLLVFADLWLVSGNSATLGLHASPDGLEQESGLATQIKQNAGLADTGVLYRSTSSSLTKDYLSRGLFRIYVHPPKRLFQVPDDSMLYTVLGSNRTILHQLFVVDGYSPVVLQRHQEMAKFVGAQDLTRYLELSNVQYSVTADDNINVSKRQTFLPRALIVGNAETILDKRAVLARLSDPLFDPYSTVILEQPPQLSGNGHAVQSQVNFLQYEPNEIEMNTISDQNGYLLLNESYYQGWKAFVDDKETLIYRANYEFKAIELPAGSHQVRFVFQPDSFRIGLGVTLLTLIGSLLFLWLNRKKLWLKTFPENYLIG